MLNEDTIKKIREFLKLMDSDQEFVIPEEDDNRTPVELVTDHLFNEIRILPVTKLYQEKVIEVMYTIYDLYLANYDPIEFCLKFDIYDENKKILFLNILNMLGETKFAYLINVPSRLKEFMRDKTIKRYDHSSKIYITKIDDSVNSKFIFAGFKVTYDKVLEIVNNLNSRSTSSRYYVSVSSHSIEKEIGLY